MTILETLSADLKNAMKARDQLLIDTLRSAVSAIKYKQVEVGHELSGEEELAVVQKQVKQRNDSISEFTKAGRTELVEKETKERDILIRYLPAQMSEDDVRRVVQTTLSELSPENRNQGAAMKVLMPKLKGQADGNLVRKLVTEELSK